MSKRVNVFVAKKKKKKDRKEGEEKNTRIADGAIVA